MNRVVVVPHCDDEVIGAGGYIAKYPETHVVVVAEPDQDRAREFAAAASALGRVGSATWLGFTDGAVGEDPRKLVSALDGAFCLLRPDEVLIPYPGSHQDHVAVYEACVRAGRHSLSPSHWMPPTILVYETPTYDCDLREWPLRYSMFEVLSEEHVRRKAAAMSAYESQNLRDHPASPSQLVERARMLGLARQVQYAEQYAPVRMVRT